MRHLSWESYFANAPVFHQRQRDAEPVACPKTLGYTHPIRGNWEKSLLKSEC
jgi:hypothetical protein